MYIAAMLRRRKKLKIEEKKEPSGMRGAVTKCPALLISRSSEGKYRAKQKKGNEC